jgi:hypothetical protein
MTLRKFPYFNVVEPMVKHQTIKILKQNIHWEFMHVLSLHYHYIYLQFQSMLHFSKSQSLFEIPNQTIS